MRHGAIDISWAGGDHTFRLGLAEIEELEATTQSSVFILYQAMAASVPLAQLKHYSETIRLGLIGGGTAPMSARALTKRYVDERPLHESAALGEAILRAAIERVYTPEPDTTGEMTAPEPSGSTSAPSTPTPPSSASPMSEHSRSASTTPSSADGTEPSAATNLPPPAKANSLPPSNA